MIVQATLSVVLAATALYYATYRGVRRHRLFVLSGFVIATYFIWNPEHTTLIAHYFGIGRGLDFILPVFCVALLFMVVGLYRKVVALQDDLTLLSRHLALRDSSEPPSSQGG